MGKGASDKYANYMTIRALEDGLEAIVGSANGEPIYYCIHSEGVWKKADMVTPAINAGDAISFKAEITPNSTFGCGNFDISKACSLEGNCMSLLYGDDVEGKPMKPYGFYSLFRYCSKIKSVSEDFLPATTLAENCYHFMFSDCSSLTNAPKLPSMSLQPYCYYGMFYGCVSLVDAPTLPATTLQGHCYRYMFYGCSSLVNAPALPAKEVINYCYYAMFSGCSSMKKAPVLPATTLVSQCYTQMFYNCKKLNYIKAMFTTTPSTSYTNNWVYGVASTGTFIRSASAYWDLVIAAYCIPSGWTVSRATS